MLDNFGGQLPLLTPPAQPPLSWIFLHCIERVWLKRMLIWLNNRLPGLVISLLTSVDSFSLLAAGKEGKGFVYHVLTISI